MNIKNNKSEAFTAVISLISLYNSVACHETYTQTLSYSSKCIYRDAHARTQTCVFFTKMGGK